MVLELRRKGFRVELDDRGERMQAKIRDAQLQKVPYMLVVGDKEAEGGGVACRLRNGTDLGLISLEDLVTRMEKEGSERST